MHTFTCSMNCHNLKWNEAQSSSAESRKKGVNQRSGERRHTNLNKDLKEEKLEKNVLRFMSGTVTVNHLLGPASITENRKKSS